MGASAPVSLSLTGHSLASGPRSGRGPGLSPSPTLVVPHRCRQSRRPAVLRTLSPREATRATLARYSELPASPLKPVLCVLQGPGLV